MMNYLKAWDILKTGNIATNLLSIITDFDVISTHCKRNGKILIYSFFPMRRFKGFWMKIQIWDLIMFEQVF